MKKLILVSCMFLLIAGTAAAQQTTAVSLLSKALYEETVNADYTKASQIYQQLLKDFASDKKSCAQATYRLGLCAEKLGQNNAQEHFIAVVEKYPDEKELVEKARAKITNTEGIQFFTDPRDGRRYKYVTIGTQAWMAENLAYMPYVSPGSVQGGIWVNGYEGSDVNEAAKLENYKNYGCLYDFQTALKACPPEWHLSTNDDWLKIERMFGYHYQESNGNKGFGLVKRPEIAKYLLKKDAQGQGVYVDYSGLGLVAGGIRSPANSRRNSFFLGSSVSGGLWSVDGINISPGFVSINPLVTRYERFNSTNDGRGLSVRCVRNEPAVSPRSPHKLILDSPREGDKIIGFTPFQVIGNKEDLIDSVCLFLVNEDHLELMSTDYSSFRSLGNSGGANVYSNGWDTRLYADGDYSVAIIAYHYGSQTDTLRLDVQVANHYPTHIDGEFTDSRDGRVYPCVKIGKQTWMARNLDYLLEEGSGSFCYNDLYTNCITYGRLYTFQTAKKACPPGWHLPDEKEWTELEVFLGFDTTLLANGEYYDKDTTGLKLKSVVGWANYDGRLKRSTQAQGTNESGFNALPGGCLQRSTFYFGLGEYTSFWVNTLDDYGSPFYKMLDFTSKCIDTASDVPGNQANYVRCIKD